MSTPVVVDPITAADGTAFTATTPTTGVPWSGNSASYANDAVVTSDRLHTAASTTTAAYENVAPGSADQYVHAHMRVVSVVGTLGINLRMSDTLRTYYSLDRSGNYWRVLSMVNGTENWFGGHSAPINPGEDHELKLEVEGSTVRYYVDDMVTPAGTYTNTDIAAAGFIGYLLNDSDAGTGYHLSDIDGGIIGSPPPGGGGVPGQRQLMGML